MFYFFAALLSLAALYAFLLGLANADPGVIVRTLRILFLAVLIVGALVTAAVGRPGIGVVLAVFAALAIMAMRGGMGSGLARVEPVLRSPWLELEIERKSGNMHGIVLAGEYEGRELGALAVEDLMSLYAAIADDESRGLLEAYLDRRVPGWRSHFEPDAGQGKGRTPGAGAMADEEAYQILGLQPGAGSTDIRKAHRRLTERMRGNGTAAPLLDRIDEARDVLLARHD